MPRVSLGFKVILAAKRVWLLAVGRGKAGVASAVLRQNTETLPASRVKPSSGVTWMLDREAAEGVS